MASSQFLQDWAWLIAVALSFAFVGLLLVIKHLQAYQARKRALASREDGDVSATYANFQRARRNFLILSVVVVVGFLAIEIWNLYFYLERPPAVR